MASKIIVLLVVGLVAAEFDIEIHKKYEELPFSEFVEYFNRLNHTWTIKDYPEPFQYMLGVIEEGKEALKRSFPVMKHPHMTDLPVNFDSRTKWPNCDSIGTIRDQGQCNSCWVFGSVNTASDRTCIHRNINVLLSEAEGTCINNSTICNPSSPTYGFHYWVEKGLVTNKCLTYAVDKANRGICNTQCDSAVNYNDDKHYGKKVYRVDAKSIRAEIVKNGPVEAGFKVFEDFFKYHGGIYEHKYGNLLGRHSVRIIGYGTEAGVDYWLVANTWGTVFGEKGFFRIKRFQDLELEKYVLTGLPK